HTRTVDFLSHLKFTPMLIHGDFWYENILIDNYKTKIKSVIDFENCTYSYNLLDFMVLEYVSKDFRNTVVQIYKEFGGKTDFESGIDDQTAILMGIRELGGLAYGLETKNIDLDCLSKIRESIVVK
ncbi:phosphotransferase, partial [candidate division WWE3 bacterium]|nr:phosphotransferase [candidate division WWE3 bacterium]